MAHAKVASEFEYLKARSAVARSLIREKVIAPEDGLALVVWPTKETRRVEQLVNRSTLASRAFSHRANR